MSNTQSRPSIPMLLLHLFLIAISGGAWLIVLIVWYLMKK